MKKIIVLACMMFMFLISCQMHSDRFLGIFPSSYEINPNKVVFDNENIRNPIMMEYMDDKLYLCDMFTSPFISIFDWSTGCVVDYYGDKGLGTNEFLGFNSMNAMGDEKLVLYDNNKRESVILYSNSSENKSERIPIEISEKVHPFKVMGLESELLLGVGIVKDARFALYNGDGHLISVFGQYPYDEGHSYTDRDVECAFAYQAAITYNDKERVLAVGNNYGEGISFYKMGNPFESQLVKEYLFKYPQYRNASTSNSSSVIFKKDNIMGFVDLDSTPDYCIGLYCGEPMQKGKKWKGGNILLLFDWEGNPLTQIILPRKYIQMAIGTDKIILLGIDNANSDFIVEEIEMSKIKY